MLDNHEVEKIADVVGVDGTLVVLDVRQDHVEHPVERLLGSFEAGK
jgi:hypothetical protein